MSPLVKSEQRLLLERVTEVIASGLSERLINDSPIIVRLEESVEVEEEPAVVVRYDRDEILKGKFDASANTVSNIQCHMMIGIYGENLAVLDLSRELWFVLLDDFIRTGGWADAFRFGVVATNLWSSGKDNHAQMLTEEGSRNGYAMDLQALLVNVPMKRPEEW